MISHDNNQERNFYIIKAAVSKDIELRGTTPKTALLNYAHIVGISYSQLLSALQWQEARLLERHPRLTGIKEIYLIELAAEHIAGEEFKARDISSIQTAYRINPNILNQPGCVKAAIKDKLLADYRSGCGILFTKFPPTPSVISREGMEHFVTYENALRAAEQHHSQVPYEIAASEKEVEILPDETLIKQFIQIQKRPQRSHHAAA